MQKMNLKILEPYLWYIDEISMFQAPAENKATDGSKPVSIGTSTVAPNIAIKC